MLSIGIDPGLDGAVAVLVDSAVCFWDTPTLQVKKRRRYNAAEMSRILRGIIGNKRIEVIATIEAVHSLPRDGTVGAFSFGHGAGIWEGILAALQIPYELIPPQTWRKAMLIGMPNDKKASVLKACQLYPSIADQLTLVKHHNRADALLIAEFGRRRWKR